ncbi:unnamed protein product [Sphagnum jensenii]|uniref:Uncharacterized protein n=1 Tax=Sphagnum jensenii TaxID=128206 RepID=A0ABP1BK34_9BRYO
MEHQLCKPQKLCSICWRVASSLEVFWALTYRSQFRPHFGSMASTSQLAHAVVEMRPPVSFLPAPAVAPVHWLLTLSIGCLLNSLGTHNPWREGTGELWKTCMRTSILSQLFFLLHEQLFLILQVQLLILRQFLFGRKLGLSCCFLLGLPGSGNSIICNKVILKAPLHLDSHLQDSFFLQLLLQLAERKRRVPCSFSELQPGTIKAS